MAGGHERKFDLTRRELEILAEVVGGYTNEEIGQKFSLSEQTVTSHLANISDKLGASDRLELILFVIHYRIWEDSFQASSSGLTRTCPIRLTEASPQESGAPTSKPKAESADESIPISLRRSDE